MKFDIQPLEGHALASAPFETQVQYTRVAMAVSPPGLIADMVSPRVRSPFKFAYTKLTERDRLTLRESRASRAGRVNEVEFGSTDATAETEDYGLVTFVPDRDLREARAQALPYDPLASAADALGIVMKMNREKRVADQIFNEDSYPTGQRGTVVSAARWEKAASDPLSHIIQALQVPLVRPNILVCGQQTWTGLRTNPKIVEAVNMSGAGDQAHGAVSRAAVAELFELDAVYVGMAQYQTANPGQDEAYAYMWGKHAALLHISRSLSSPSGMMPSFAFTAEAMGMEVATYGVEQRGIGRGSTAVKISESCKEVVAWSKAGYFFKDAVS